MREAIELKNEFYEKWLSPNGLALLNVGDKENDNGILFYAMFMQMLKEFDLIGQKDRDHSKKLLTALQERPGLLNRRPGDNLRREAHDNYVGAQVLSINVIGDRQFSDNCVIFGQSHGWNYNNTDPDKWIKETQRQLGEVAFYQICAGNTPDPFSLIWLCAGLIIAAFQWSGVINLAWLRLRVLNTAKKSQPVFFVVAAIDATTLVFNVIVASRGGIIKFVKSYFKDSIYSRLADVVWG